jgi:HEAT repeat protein
MPSKVSSDPLAALRTTGEKLPEELKAAVLALGREAIPSLLALLEDEALADADAPGDGWPPVHAVRLLGELKAEEAIGPFLRILREGDDESWLVNDADVNLPKIGPAIVEPVLAAFGETDEPEEMGPLAYALANCGAKDERIFEALEEFFHENEFLGAMALADYGDERGLPLIREVIEAFVPDPGSPLGARDLIDYVDSYERIAGSMPAELAAHVEKLREDWAARRAVLVGPARSTKVGRNEACPCKSGKKYKKCCLGKAAVAPGSDSPPLDGGG